MKRLLVLALWIVSACGDDNDSSRSLPQGNFSIEVLEVGSEIRLKRGDELLLHFDQESFQLGLVQKLDESSSYDPYWLVHEDPLFKPDPPKDLRFLMPSSFAARTADDGAIIVDLTYDQNTSATVELRAEESKSPNAGVRYSMLWRPTARSPVAYMRLAPYSQSSSEGFYGLGEHPDGVNHRGKIRAMQLEADLSVEGASNEVHTPVPLLIGTSGFGMFVESKRFGVFDVARKLPTLIEVTYGTAEQSDQGLLVHLYAANHPLDVTRLYYDTTSNPLLPAEWAYGPWIWRDENEDQAEVEADIKKIRELDLPTSAIWIDRPYATAVNTFDFDAAKFPNAQSMIDTAHAAGLRMALWSTPYLEEAAVSLLAEANQRDFFPPRVGVRLNGWGDPLDFTNPEAFAWWQQNIDRYTSMGIEGFKLDYGEDVVSGLGNARTPWAFADGSTEKTAHYDYTLLYHGAYAEKLPASGGFLLCRTGRWGDQKNVSVIWPGDLDATLTKWREPVDDGDIGVGGLPTALSFALGLGPSGFPFFGSDTGGYRHSPPNRETFIRWFQQTALSAVMQVGDSSSQPPWVYTPENGRDDATLDLYRDFARLHLRLFPYVWSYAQRLAVDGRAIMRPLGLAFPSLGAHPDDIYMFGDHLLVAPVVTAGVVKRAIPFPPGRWINFFDASVIEGGSTVEVDAPLEVLPLFVREGGIVPMLRPTIDTLATTTSTAVESYANEPGVLHVVIAPGGSGTTFSLFDGGSITLDGEMVRLEQGSKLTGGWKIETLGGGSIELPAGDHTVPLP